MLRLTLLLFLLLATSSPAQPGGGPSPVEVAVATEEPVAPMLTLPGTAVPIRRAKVPSMTAGLVVDRQAFFSQKKMKGDLLVKLDSVRAEARADAARALAEEAKARYELMLAGERPEMIAARRADVARAKSAHVNAQKDWDRVRSLFAKRAVSENDVDAARAKLDAEKANVDVAQANLRVAEAGSRPQEIAAQKAIWERARAQQAEAEKELDERTIRAPFDGYVAEVFVEVGDHVVEGGPILELVDLSYLDVVVLVPESRASQVPKGESAEIEFRSGNASAVVTGVIAAVGPQATLKGRTVAVVLRFRNEGEKFRSGASAAVRLPAGEKLRRLVIPKDAVVRSASAPPMVYVVSDGKANPRPVKLGLDAGSKIVVTEGLKAGEIVVERGNERLRPGAPVQISTGTAAVQQK